MVIQMFHCLKCENAIEVQLSQVVAIKVTDGIASQQTLDVKKNNFKNVFDQFVGFFYRSRNVFLTSSVCWVKWLIFKYVPNKRIDH